MTTINVLIPIPESLLPERRLLDRSSFIEWEGSIRSLLSLYNLNPFLFCDDRRLKYHFHVDKPDISYGREKALGMIYISLGPEIQKMVPRNVVNRDEPKPGDIWKWITDNYGTKK